MMNKNIQNPLKRNNFFKIKPHDLKFFKILKKLIY